MSSFKISEELVEKFQKDGAVYIPNFFDKKWIEAARIGIKNVMANPSKYGENLRPVENEGAYFNDYCNWRNFPELVEYVYNSPAAELVAQLMKSDVW